MVEEQNTITCKAIKKKGLSQKLLAKKLSAVRFFYLFLTFRKLAMRYAIILLFYFLETKLTVFNK